MLLYALSMFSVTTLGFSAAESMLPYLPVTTCKRDSADFSECLKHAIEEAWPRIVKGLPEFDFPTLDPLIIEHAAAKINLGEIRAEVTVSNHTIIGLSKIRFLGVRTHFLDDVFRLEIDADLSWVFTEGVVEGNGTINMFKITGKGYFNETLNDIRGTWDLTGHVVNDTWIVEHFRVTPSIGKFKMYFNNMLEEGKEFSDFAVDFINEYWPSLYRISLPIMADIYDAWLTDFPNKIFSKVPFSEIFP